MIQAKKKADRTDRFFMRKEILGDAIWRRENKSEKLKFIMTG
jgi:hypothetical protein